jgi:hypothetical protein
MSLESYLSSQHSRSSSWKTPVLSTNEIFHLLHTSRRRETIRYLQTVDGPIHMTELAKHVAAVENETPREELTTRQYERVYVPLYQSHLPKLDEAGVIIYDQSRGVIKPTGRLNVFRPYLGSSPASASSRGNEVSNWYPVAVVLSGLLLFGVALEFVPLSGDSLGWIIVAIFLVANTIAT